MNDPDNTLRVNPGYALNQLLQALGSSGDTAAARAAQWRRVLAAMFDGTVRYGSRTPVAETPAWVTLEVAQGGFATGEFLAAGPLMPHELEKLHQVDRSQGVTERAALNAYYLSSAGRAELTALLLSGCYRVTVPEEAALLAIAWLVDHGEAPRAEGILEALAPFFDRLRFYPVPAERPAPTGEGVYVEPASSIDTALRSRRQKPSLAAMKEAILVWTPLYDRTVELFMQTVEGEMPRVAASETGGFLRRADGTPIIEGGWPCRRFPNDWAERARSLLEQYERERATHQLCGKPEKPKENFARLRGYLARAAGSPAELTSRDVGMIRTILASYVTSHGAPGSDRLSTTRMAQARNAALPGHPELAKVLADRIVLRGTDEGVPDVDECLVPLTQAEAITLGVEAGWVFPPSLARKALRCLEAPIETLIARQLVLSSEGVARLVPHLTAQVRASAIAQPELRRVYELVYRAFRRRRSLLLLNLASQVRLEELPWIAALRPWLGASDVSQRSSRAAMVRVTRLALESFPQTILPNKLVRELRTLASAAGLAIPLVDELAADIFVGAFSEKYLQSAQVAASVLAGTLYEDYYGLPLDRVVALNDLEATRYKTPTSAGFYALCAELAGAKERTQWSVASNGTIIEQCQILTTHNLAQLVKDLDILEEIHAGFPELARRCFTWICTRLQLPGNDWYAAMQQVKNAAYAWRQMIFYLSFAEPDETPRFLAWADDHLHTQREDFRQRFAPVMGGLRAVVEGARFGDDGWTPTATGRRFLGWTVGQHWLLPARETTSTP